MKKVIVYVFDENGNLIEEKEVLDETSLPSQEELTLDLLADFEERLCLIELGV